MSSSTGASITSEPALTPAGRSSVDFSRRFGAVILLDEEKAAAAFPSGLPHLVDAGYRLAGAEGFPELVDDLAAARLEVVPQDRPRRFAKVVGVGMFVGAVDAPDDEVSG